MAESAAPLANIKKIAGQLVYGGGGRDKQRDISEDVGSASEYEPMVTRRMMMPMRFLGKKRSMSQLYFCQRNKPIFRTCLNQGKQASTKPHRRERTRSRHDVPTTTRATRASKSKRNQKEENPLNDNETPPHQTSKDINSPQAEMEHSQDMTNTSSQIDNTVTLRCQGPLVSSTGPTNPDGSKRTKRRPTMGHGLRDYTRWNGGRKMKIDFSAGRLRLLDPVQAAKLTSQCGLHARTHKMHVASHWKDYKEKGLDHHIPKAIGHVAKHFEMDPKEELSKSVCTNILQKSIWNHRYRLKKQYFNGHTVVEALANKPPNLSPENWEALVNKWFDQRNKEICRKNKDNREAVKHQQTTGSRSYPSHFHQVKIDKYNNADPSPIEFFRETHTNKKTGCMSTAALDAYTAMQDKRCEAQSEDEQPVCDTQIVAEVLKEHSSSSTFLSTMGYQSRSGRTRTSASTERVRELEESFE